MNHVHFNGWHDRLATIAHFCAAVGFRAEITDIDVQIADLRRQQRQLLARSDAILASADEASRELTADERRSIRQRTQQVEHLETEVAELEAEASRPQARLTPINAGERLGSGATIRAAAGAAPRAQTYSGTARYADMFGPPQAAASEFASLGAFALAVAAGGNDRRLQASATTSTTGEGVSAGYLVPTHFAEFILDQALLQEVVRPRANVVPVTSGQAAVSGFDYVDGTGSRRAGLFLDWGSEATTLTPQKPKARELSAQAKKASIYCRVSVELAADARNFDQKLSFAMIAATAAGLDRAFIAGTGAGLPLGIANAPALITVSKESGQAAGTILLQNLAKMCGRLTPSSFARSVWLVHPTAVPQLYLMSYTVKNVAGTENVGGAAAQAITVDGNGQLRIFGLPALISEACEPVGSVGDIVLADLSQYLIAMRSDVRLQRDDSVHFDSDEIAFKLTMRLDGMPEGAAPTKLRDGTNTVSPFVTLEAR